MRKRAQRSAMRDNSVRDAITALEDAGLEPWIETGKHHKIKWHDHRGHEQTLVMAVTPGDRRGEIKTRCRVRRMIRAATEREEA